MSNQGAIFFLSSSSHTATVDGTSARSEAQRCRDASHLVLAEYSNVGANVRFDFARLQALLRGDREVLALQRIRASSRKVERGAAPRARRDALEERAELLRDGRDGGGSRIECDGDAQLEALSLTELRREEETNGGEWGGDNGKQKRRGGGEPQRKVLRAQRERAGRRTVPACVSLFALAADVSRPVPRALLRSHVLSKSVRCDARAFARPPMHTLSTATSTKPTTVLSSSSSIVNVERSLSCTTNAKCASSPNQLGGAASSTNAATLPVMVGESTGMPSRPPSAAACPCVTVTRTVTSLRGSTARPLLRSTSPPRAAT